MAGITPSRFVKRPGRPRDHGSSQTKAHPLPPVELRGLDHRQHHHRERADDGDDQATADVGEMSLGGDLGRGLPAISRRWNRAVAETFDCIDESFDVGFG